MVKPDEVKDQFLNLGRFKLVSGNQIRFWEDKWLRNPKLKVQFSNLFNIVRRKYATVAEVLSLCNIHKNRTNKSPVKSAFQKKIHR